MEDHVHGPFTFWAAHVDTKKPYVTIQPKQCNTCAKVLIMRVNDGYLLEECVLSPELREINVLKDFVDKREVEA